MTSTHQMLSHVQQSDSCLVAQEDASSFNIDQNITLPVVSIQEQLQALQGKNHRVICIHNKIKGYVRVSSLYVFDILTSSSSH